MYYHTDNCVLIVKFLMSLFLNEFFQFMVFGNTLFS